MTALYNEIDPKAAAWLRELIRQGQIAPGDVSEADIRDLSPDYVGRYTQCHFFAGIGVWSYALRRAGWPDDRPIWTGSAPCQPFSAAGKGGGFDDERHLWPHFHWLISQCRPDDVVGEQVASKDGLAWIDLVQADLEGTGYASGALDFCSAGVGAPHIRQRLYWFGERLEHATGDGRLEWRAEPGERGLIGRRGAGGLDDDDDARLEGRRGRYQAESGRIGEVRPTTEAGELGGLADRDSAGSPENARDIGQIGGVPQAQRQSEHGAALSGRGGELGELANAERIGHGEQQRDTGAVGASAGRGTGPQSELGRSAQETVDRRQDGGPGPTNGFWGAADWLHCRDHKWRPVEPGTFPLAHGAPARVGRLRGYGNAINAEAATVFIESYLEAKAERRGFRLTGVSDLPHDSIDKQDVFA